MRRQVHDDAVVTNIWNMTQKELHVNTNKHAEHWSSPQLHWLSGWDQTLLKSHLLCDHQQSGAAEACWAHNPEVDGSKPSSAKI